MGLDADFEATLREAALEDAEEQLRTTVGPQLKAVARDRFEAYAGRNGYDIDHIWTEATGPHIDRGEDAVSVRVEWPGLTALFEFGSQWEENPRRN